MLFLIVLSCCFIGLTRANYGSPPSVVTEVIAVERGQLFYDLCYSTGDKITDIYWIKPNGERVKEDQRSNLYSSQEHGQLLPTVQDSSQDDEGEYTESQSIRTTLSLTILEPSQADEGEYVCQEINDKEETTILKRLFLRINAKAEPRFEEPYVLVETYEDENVTLTCEAEGNRPMQYKWTDKHNQYIENSSNAVVINKEDCSELHLLQVSKETNTLYTCIAANNLGTDSKVFEIVVHLKENIFPPFFKQDKEVVYSEEFRNLTLKCVASSNPFPSYKWFDKDGTELNKDHPRVITSSETKDRLNSSIIIEVSRNYGLLTFVSLMKSDRGNYTCRAETYLGRAVKTYEVYVTDFIEKRPPVFNETRVSVYGSEDEVLILNCQAEGKPEPTYVWYNLYGEKLDRFHQRVIDIDIWNHSLEIPHKRPSTILVSPSNGTLIFVQLKRNDSGHYACYAENSLGRASKTYRIYVNETDVTKGYLTARVQNVTHNSVTFELVTRDVSAVRGFEVRYTLAGKRNFTSIRWSAEQEYKVTGLLSGAKYSFEFRTLSSDNWTEPILVALPPGPPEIIVRQVTGNRLSMEFFRPFYLFGYNSIESYIIKYRTVQQVGGNTWKYRECEVTIELPACYGSSYEISNLASRVYYSITVQAVGPGGHSELSEMKIYVP